MKQVYVPCVIMCDILLHLDEYMCQLNHKFQAHSNSCILKISEITGYAVTTLRHTKLYNPPFTIRYSPEISIELWCHLVTTIYPKCGFKFCLYVPIICGTATNWKSVSLKLFVKYENRISKFVICQKGTFINLFAQIIHLHSAVVNRFSRNLLIWINPAHLHIPGIRWYNAAFCKQKVIHLHVKLRWKITK